MAWEWERGVETESIRRFLNPGDYSLRILDQDPSLEPIEYSITTEFQAAATDNLAFSINLVYVSGLEGLNSAAREAVARAADFWEQVISHSSFDLPFSLAIGLYGSLNRDDPFLAYAGPQSYSQHRRSASARPGCGGAEPALPR
ncbi:MAG: hypothetical protein HC824_06700 [Synechococcales cyanobacterium RM1_1_8]|nr:hypothetical protein [Synechococcales cyanobacterium RM1_1_8]